MFYFHGNKTLFHKKGFESETFWNSENNGLLNTNLPVFRKTCVNVRNIDRMYLVISRALRFLVTANPGSIQQIWGFQSRTKYRASPRT